MNADRYLYEKNIPPAKAAPRSNIAPVRNPWSGTPSPYLGGTNPTQEQIDASLEAPSPIDRMRAISDGSNQGAPSSLSPEALKAALPLLQQQLRGVVPNPAPVPAGRYGQHSENKVTEEQLVEQESKRNSMWSPEEFNKFGQAIMESPAMRPQADAINNLKSIQDASAGFMADQGRNIAPTLAGIGNIIGRDTLKGYNQPMSGQEKMAVLNQFANKLVDQNQDMGKQILSGYQAMKSGSDMSKYQNKLLEMQSAGFKNPNPFNMMGAIMNGGKYVQDKSAEITKNLEDKHASLDALEQAIDTGQVGDIKLALPIAARALSGDVGRISDRQLTAVLPHTAGMDLSTALAYITSDPTVNVDQGVIQGLKHEVYLARQRANSKAQTELSTFTNSVGAIPGIGPMSGNIIKPHAAAVKAQVDAHPKDETPPGPSIMDLFNKAMNGH